MAVASACSHVTRCEQGGSLHGADPKALGTIPAHRREQCGDWRATQRRNAAPPTSTHLFAHLSAHAQRQRLELRVGLDGVGLLLRPRAWPRTDAREALGKFRSAGDAPSRTAAATAAGTALAAAYSSRENAVAHRFELKCARSGRASSLYAALRVRCRGMARWRE